MSTDELFTEINRLLCGISGSVCGAKAALNHGGRVSWDTIAAIQTDADDIEQAVNELRKQYPPTVGTTINKE